MAGVGVGGKLVGPIAVDAGTVVKVLDDVCGASRGEWWRVQVTATGEQGFIPAAVALSTADGSSGNWSSD